ncbi:TPA: fimbria/pilus periplasmic chaperone [Klebsiella oxytoca]|nr:fimbria/pilus periplasmic chaperone [Klebsiella michiganensis]HEC2122613.1 fimbria/pilus periplasmic chaperone [Klebsiella oxytoca]
MLVVFRQLRKNSLACLLGVALYSLPILAQAAGGIALQGTRIVYPLKGKQATLRISNSSKTDTFLVQSWVEAADGSKTKDFVVTPPLYASGPENENTLRLMHVGSPLPTDRESLYYFVAKAIPSVDEKANEGKNVLYVAAANRIKLFVRPAGLKPDISVAPAELTFRKTGAKLAISNPTPYYLTLTDVKAGSQSLEVVMVPPKGEASIPLPAGSSNSITYRTINDYGALTDVQKKSIN